MTSERLLPEIERLAESIMKSRSDFKRIDRTLARKLNRLPCDLQRELLLSAASCPRYTKNSSALLHWLINHLHTVNDDPDVFEFYDYRTRMWQRWEQTSCPGTRQWEPTINEDSPPMGPSRVVVVDDLVLQISIRVSSLKVV